MCGFVVLALVSFQKFALHLPSLFRLRFSDHKLPSVDENA